MIKYGISDYIQHVLSMQINFVYPSAFFILVSYMDRHGLFCHSDDFIDTIEHGTLFCTLSGKINLID